MAKVLITDSILSDLASAIRSKNGSTATYTPSEMVSAISALQIDNGDFEKLITGEQSGVYNNSNITQIKAGVFWNTKITFASCQNVISIHASAFYNCTSLTSVSFPNLKTLYSYAFGNCYSLIEINLPEYIRNTNVIGEGEYAFSNCYKLQSAIMPKVKQLAEGMFQNCQSLINVSIPQCSVIGMFAFQGCKKLPYISLPQVSIIYRGTFAYCSSLSSLYAPLLTELQGSLYSQSVGVYASTQAPFVGCTSLSSIDTSNLESITGFNVFYGLTMSSFVFPKLISISSGAFYSYTTGTLQYINCSILSILPNGLFSTISTLTSYSFPKVTSIGDNAFHLCRISTANFPEAVSVGASAFFNCISITNVSFPKLTTIKNGAFQGCYNISVGYFPEVNVIYSSAFYNCSSLNTLIFPKLSSISGAYNFCSCYHLLSLQLLSSSMCTLGSRQAFTSTPISTYTTSTGGVNGSIFVPASLYDSQKTATNWTYYSARFASLTDAQISAILAQYS